MILHIPVRRKTVRIDGASTSVLELANGFCEVTLDGDAQSITIGGTAERGRVQISNPFSETFLDWFNRGIIGSSDRIAIHLVELPNSNPGQDDESTSLTHLDQIV